MLIQKIIYPFKISKMLLAIVFIILLSSCTPYKKPILYINPSLHKSVEKDPFTEVYEYLYESPQIYRTWINARKTPNNKTVTAHYRYWAPNQGNSNVPLKLEHEQNANLLSPS